MIVRVRPRNLSKALLELMVAHTKTVIANCLPVKVFRDILKRDAKE